MREEQYLSIKVSLGYKNVKQALWTIFSVNLDEILIHDGEDENFNFVFTYKNCEMTMGISSTGKYTQFEAGEGGLFNVWFSHYVGKRFAITFLYEVIGDESIKRVFGKDEQSIEYAMRVLKDYLDSDEAKVLLKNE